MSDLEESEHSPELDNLEEVFAMASKSLDTSSRSLRNATNSEPSLAIINPSDGSTPSTSTQNVEEMSESESTKKDETKGRVRSKRVRQPKIPEEAEPSEQKHRSPRKKRKKLSNEPERQAENAEEKSESATISEESVETKTEEKKRPKRKDRMVSSIICQLTTGAGEPGCKQRAILGYRYCIRHILNDPESPYQQCAHTRRPKNKNEKISRCTNAIKKDSGEAFCSTHLIMAGLKEVKKKHTVDPAAGKDVSIGTNSEGQSRMELKLSMEPPRVPKVFPAPVVFEVAEQELLKRQRLEELAKLNAAAEPQSLVRPPPVTPTRSPQMKPPETVLPPLQPLLESPLKELPISLELKVPVIQVPKETVKKEEGKEEETEAETDEIEQTEPATQSTEEEATTEKPIVRRTEAELKHLFSLANDECKQVMKNFLERMKTRKPIEATQWTQMLGKTRPMEIKPELMQKVDTIWNKLDKINRKRWSASIMSRASMKVARGELPFSMGELEKANPTLVRSMLQVRKKIPPTRILYNKKKDPPPIPKAIPPFRTLEPSSDEDEDLDPEHIKLKVRERIRTMIGPYRDIPTVNDMCNKIERTDFDEDMFPLGFESSSDDEADDDNMLHKALPSHPASMIPLSEVRDKEMEMYFLRKQLRLERHQLMDTAQINAPIMTALRKHPLSVGAALRQKLEKRPLPTQMIQPTMRRCSQIENKQRCERACLPCSNHCSIHVLYNVNQKLFQFCTHPQFCRRPVLAIDATLWDGKCKLHRDSRIEKFGEYPIYDTYEPEENDNNFSEEPGDSQSSSESESDEEDEEDEDEEEVDEEEEEDAAI